MTSPLGSGGSNELAVKDATVQVRDDFRSQLRAALSDPLFSVPADFVTWMIDRIAVSGLPIGIGQIVGFSNFTVQAAPNVDANEATSSVYPAYTALATAGPSLSGLPNGTYIFWFGAQAKNTAGVASLMGLSVNGAAPDNTTSAATNSMVYTQIARAWSADLTADNNTVTAQYAVASGDGNFSLRYLYALKLANL